MIVDRHGTTDAAPERAALDLRVAVTRLRRRMREVSADGGLTAPQASVLAHLGKGEVATASALAALEGVRPQSIATTVASLERLGLIVRSPDPTDGRRQLIALTDAGRRAANGNLDARRAWLAEVMARRLDEDERGVILAAADLIRRLAAP